MDYHQYDSKGRCARHSEVQLRKKKLLGGWKVLLSHCPSCILEDMEAEGLIAYRNKDNGQPVLIRKLTEPKADSGESPEADDKSEPKGHRKNLVAKTSCDSHLSSSTETTANTSIDDSERVLYSLSRVKHPPAANHPVIRMTRSHPESHPDSPESPSEEPDTQPEPQRQDIPSRPRRHPRQRPARKHFERSNSNHSYSEHSTHSDHPEQSPRRPRGSPASERRHRHGNLNGLEDLPGHRKPRGLHGARTCYSHDAVQRFSIHTYDDQPELNPNRSHSDHHYAGKIYSDRQDRPYRRTKDRDRSRERNQDKSHDRGNSLERNHDRNHQRDHSLERNHDRNHQRDNSLERNHDRPLERIQEMNQDRDRSPERNPDKTQDRIQERKRSEKDRKRSFRSQAETKDQVTNIKDRNRSFRSQGQIPKRASPDRNNRVHPEQHDRNRSFRVPSNRTPAHRTDRSDRNRSFRSNPNETHDRLPQDHTTDTPKQTQLTNPSSLRKQFSRSNTSATNASSHRVSFCDSVRCKDLEDWTVSSTNAAETKCVSSSPSRPDPPGSVMDKRRSRRHSVDNGKRPEGWVHDKSKHQQRVMVRQSFRQ